MTQTNPLSEREKAVLEVLLKGKSNKQIALALGISTRTVEFHLKNIYAKSQVRSRIELILKLGNATGGAISENLGCSTVDRWREKAENKDKPNSQINQAPSLRRLVSPLGEELKMKNLFHPKYLLLGVITALITGFSWLAVLVYYGNLTVDEIEACAVPLIAILTIIGLAVAIPGNRINSTLRRVFFSILLGTSLSFFSILPIMLVVVIPIQQLMERLGLMDPLTYHVGRVIGAVSMIAIWLVVGVLMGNALLFFTIGKPERLKNHIQATENSL